MKKLLNTICFLIVLNQTAHAEQCMENAGELHASYQIRESVQGRGQTIRSMSLYRINGQVGHFFDDKQYGDWWSKNSNEQVMLFRYFPNYQQAIEYQQDEIQKGKRYSDFWQKKQQLISPELLSKMTLIDVEKQGCNRIELLSYSSKGKKYHLRWIANLNLLEQLDVYKGNDKIINWTLLNISTEVEVIKNYAATIQSYQSTDYADIGDNESNPFLAKMIHQGFTQQEISSDSGSNKKPNKHSHNHDH